MLCDKCKKNPASIKLQQVVNGEKIEVHICPTCASSFGLGDEDKQNQFEIDSTSLDGLFEIFFSSLLAHGKKTPFPLLENGDPFKDPNVCPTCSTSYKDFKDSGRMGCEDCYTTFKTHLSPIFRSIQSGSDHRGKIPLRCGAKFNIERKIEEISEKLKFAVANEDYELAAQLRDERDNLSKPKPPKANTLILEEDLYRDLENTPGGGENE